jgi:hypothetical protein
MRRAWSIPRFEQNIAALPKELPAIESAFVKYLNSPLLVSDGRRTDDHVPPFIR